MLYCMVYHLFDPNFPRMRLPIWAALCHEVVDCHCEAATIRAINHYRRKLFTTCFVYSFPLKGRMRRSSTVFVSRRVEKSFDANARMWCLTEQIRIPITFLQSEPSSVSPNPTNRIAQARHLVGRAPLSRRTIDLFRSLCLSVCRLPPCVL